MKTCSHRAADAGTMLGFRVITSLPRGAAAGGGPTSVAELRKKSDRGILYRWFDLPVMKKRYTIDVQVVLEECHVELPVPDPGETPLVSLPAGPADTALAEPAWLRTGDIHSSLFTLRGDAAARGVSLGTLLLRWRRARCGPDAVIPSRMCCSF